MQNQCNKDFAMGLVIIFFSILAYIVINLRKYREHNLPFSVVYAILH